MPLLPVQVAGWLRTVNDNFDQLKAIVSGLAGLGAMRVAQFDFDPTADATKRPIAAYGTGITLPANAVVMGGFFSVNTAFTSAGGNTGQIAISVEGANDIQTAAAVGGAPYSTIGRKAIVPKINTPETTSIKVTTAKEVTVTVSVAALTAGKLTGYLFYVEGAPSA